MIARTAADSASRRRRWLALALTAAGCTQSGFESSEPRVVSLRMAAGITSSAPLRAAVVYMSSGTDYVVVEDVAFEAPAVDIELTLPEQSRLARVAPIAKLTITERSPKVSAYRPRIVVYADRDENARFEPELSERAGPDEFVAIDPDDAGYAAVLDLDAALERLPLDDAEAYYAATDGHYTPFVYTLGRGPLQISSAPPSVVVSGDPVLARASFECLRNASAAFGVIDDELLLDEAVDPELCDLGRGTCEVTKLDERDAPELPSDSLCRTDGDVDALIMLSSRASCQRCSCRLDQLKRVLIASKNALPWYWPCGDEVRYCVPEAELTLGLVCQLVIEDE